MESDRDRDTDRLEVPGGWLYLVTEKGDGGIGILKQHLVFVPKPPKADRGELGEQ